jgi:aldehyde:ferredoxin oxidoreductase
VRGVHNRVLVVNVTSGSHAVRSLPDTLYGLVVGGRGLGAALALAAGLDTVDALGQDNQLIITTGPLTGFAPGGGGAVITSKSPLSSTLNDSLANGMFGYSCKVTGVDAIAISGASPAPAYLLVTDERVELRPADDLWGMTTRQTEAVLRERHSELPNLAIATIGRAGETKVRFASIMSGNHAFGRGGLGAVMGSKALKAIVLGGASLPVGHPLKKRGGEPPTKVRGLSDQGTLSFFEKALRVRALTANNYRDRLFAAPGASQAIGESEQAEDGCFDCDIHCKRAVCTSSGFAGTRMPEFESFWSLGANCGIADHRRTIELASLCDDLGLDAMSAGNVLGFYLECLERHVLPQSSSHDPRVVIQSISDRVGIGDVLGEGVARAADLMGPDCARFASHVKGLETPAHDPRPFAGIGLALSVSSRGACHRKSFCSEEADGLIDGATIEGKAERVFRTENKRAAIDSLVVCKWADEQSSLAGYAAELSAVTHVDWTQEDLYHVGRRIVTMARLFYCRQGGSESEDWLPPRLMQGTNRAQLQTMKQRYYSLRGWAADGKPTQRAVQRLRIDAVMALAEESLTEETPITADG